MNLGPSDPRRSLPLPLSSDVPVTRHGPPTARFLLRPSSCACGSNNLGLGTLLPPGLARRMPFGGGAPLGGGTLPQRLILAGGGATGGGGAPRL